MSLQQKVRASVGADGVFNLAAHDTADTPGVDGKDQAKQELADMADELFDLHEKLFAEDERALLLVLQGTDASGKNGTIKHVVRLVNPAGVSIASFVEPTEEERAHHFLWRIRKQVPRAGRLGVFDRSHYEDVLVPAAEGTVSAAEIDQRLEDINHFEHELTESGVTVLKCLLHISYDEQRDRFLRRLRRDDKRWKFSEADLETRQHWDQYQAAYGQTVAATHTDHAPWHVIPSDHKWYRNWAAASLLIETLTEMDPRYPEPDFDLEVLRQRLGHDA
ncbi:MAG: polyphosphate kinase 2 family protein [Acidimicrobiia bacterium]|nr:polyphosphate kinase 2 family protein [Acidimicrobiia bacterium]